MQDSKASTDKEPRPESDDARFDKSLQELKDLRFQLHYAADYCETAFLKAKHRKMLVENTKEYICNAMVTVVDHLGSVSANLECLLSCRVEPSLAELRINGLQREYTSELDLANMRWSAKFPIYQPRYTSPLIPPLDRSKALILRDASDLVASGPTYQSKIHAEETTPRVAHPDKSFNNKNLNKHLPPGFEFSAVLPAREGPSILFKPRIPSFRSQTKKLRCHDQGKKEVQSSNFLPFLRRSRRSV
ncbi:probable protein ABIL5 isoform X2 [Magnolia sinica]|uniref:probable protein ABIL5 isoform X2 n=1 Tax=Magnolia sinica TaxID=86752 RepID=UPI002657D6C9|nr:probable protein ABIL5 isoform X2 [Magnolia sinica]